MEGQNVRYFVAKVLNIDSVKKCVNTEQWACRDRNYPPQPREILTEAIDQGFKVILVFSVNNCHGWHGYAEIKSKPDVSKCNAEKEVNFSEESPQNCIMDTEGNEERNSTFSRKETEKLDPEGWYYFKVKWVRYFVKDFGEQCLSFQKTADLILVDGSPLNKARNWQEIAKDSGGQICQELDNLYLKLQAKHQAKIAAKEERKPATFFTGSGETKMIQENWHRIIKKVESELGQVILACPFGSQRYNLHTESSDMDMFIVYKANTRKVLGFDPPKQTVKNYENDECDYTIHEVYRFCELLLGGDHRCVETLFLHSSSIYQSSLDFQELQNNNNIFLNRNCLDKYMRDATGGKGTKLFQKWSKDIAEQDIVMPDKLNKLGYIICRLLQNASDIVDGTPLQVYRPDDSPERKLLMDIRHGRRTLQQANEIISRLQSHVESEQENVTNNSQEVRTFLEDWLINLRYKNFETNS